MTTSLNEVICHGIPDDTVLEDGDIINIDITVYKDGYHGDHNKTFLVGNVDEESRLLVERTEKALERAIKAVKPGREINVIGRVIETYAKRFGYGVVEDFVGHGVGKEFHSGLIVPHYDTAPRHNEVMQPDGLHHRADAHTWWYCLGSLGRRLDGHDQRQTAQCTV